MGEPDLAARGAALDRWREHAAQLDWEVAPEEVFADGPDGGRWFPGGELDLVHNCVDRHAAADPRRPALAWEGEPGDRRILTYGALQREVDACAAALAALGVGTGDRVALHLGLVPEAVIALLACARLAATSAVLPPALPSDALGDRLRDLRARLVITQDGAWRHGVVLPLKARVDEALAEAGSVEQTLVVRRAGIDVPWYEGDRWWHDLLAAPRPGSDRRRSRPRPVSADHPGTVTYVANRRGVPTGLVHGTANLLVTSLAMHRDGFGLDAGDVTWVPAELGWLAVHSHGILGPLVTGGTAVLYEGMLDTPHRGRAWEIVARYRVTGLIATPSVARALRRWVERSPRPDQVASLRVIVTAGEAIDDATTRWLHEVVGGGRADVANAWGLTELGGAVAVEPPVTAQGAPPLGLEVVGPDGAVLDVDTEGDLVLTLPWPGTASHVLDEPSVRPGRDPARPDTFVTGDRARRRADGTIEFLGRTDRLFSVSGQLVSAAEVRTVLEEHPFVVRAEAVDRPDPRTGRAVVAYVQLGDGSPEPVTVADELRLHVHATLGGLAQPQAVVLVDRFPTDVAEPALLGALQAHAANAARVDRIEEPRLRTLSLGLPRDDDS